jgi:hypothetical protein
MNPVSSLDVVFLFRLIPLSFIISQSGHVASGVVLAVEPYEPNDKCCVEFFTRTVIGSRRVPPCYAPAG